MPVRNPYVLEVHGVAHHTDVTRDLFFPVHAGMIVAGTPSVGIVYPSIEGGANADDPDVYISMKVPSNFASFTSVKAIWNTPIPNKNMYWKLTARYAAEGEIAHTHLDEPALGVTASEDAPWKWRFQEPANALTLVNLALGDVLTIRFYREGSDALDTLDDTMYLLGILFTYVASQ